MLRVVGCEVGIEELMLWVVGSGVRRHRGKKKQLLNRTPYYPFILKRGMKCLQRYGTGIMNKILSLEVDKKKSGIEGM